MIAIRNLCKSYIEGDRQRTIFTGLNLDLERGQFIALLGQSGSGKSTLLNLLGGIDRPDAGEIEIADQTITALSEVERSRFRRRQIGFVFQFFNLIPTLTVAENLLLPLELNGLATPWNSVSGRWNCWIMSGWVTAGTVSRSGCLAGSNNGWR